MLTLTAGLGWPQGSNDGGNEGKTCNVTICDEKKYELTQICQRKSTYVKSGAKGKEMGAMVSQSEGVMVV